MNQRKKSKHWKKIVSWILALCICMTSVEWPAVAHAEKNSEEIHVQSEEEFTSLEDDQELINGEAVEKTEIPEERTKNSTTWQLSNGMKQTVYYSSDVRYEDEEGELVDYDSSLVSVEEEDPVSSEAYLYVNARGDRKHYIPKEIGYDTPLLMENGEYSLEVNPLFGQTEEIPTDDPSSKGDVSKKESAAEKKAGSISNSEAVKLNEADIEEFQKASEDSNAFQELSSLEPVEVKQEKTADLYGDVEEKTTSAVYSAPDQSFNLEYVPFESGVKENLILNEKPDTNVWQFAFTLGGGLTARKNVMNEGISFYAVDNDAEDSDDEKILVGGIQVPYMNDATEENYSENITYDLETVSEEDGSYVLTMTVDPEYLNDPETVYPVTIDPSYSWTGGSAVYDVYVLSGSSYADLNFYDTSTTGMFAGRTNANGYERTYISFNGLADKISGYSVASAKLVIYETGGGTAGETVQAHTVKAAWNKSTLTWNNRPGYNTTALSSFTNNATANHKGTLDITSYARGVAKGTSDYGIMLRTKDEAVSKYAKFYGSRHSSTSYRPKLTVTYIAKPATASSVSVSPVWAKKNAAISVTWADINSSALKSIQYRIALMSDDGKETLNSEFAPYASNPVIGTTASGTASINTTALGEGRFRIYVRGVDQYGSVGAGKAASFVLDGTAPTLSSASLTPSTSTSSYSSNKQPVIKWSGASDKYLKQVQYSLDGGAYSSMGTTASGSFTIPSGKITSSGKHTIKVRAIDKSGNASSVKTLYYYADVKGPSEGTFNLLHQDGTAAEGWTKKQDLKVTFSGVKDDNSGIAASGIQYAFVEENSTAAPTYITPDNPILENVDSAWNGSFSPKAADYPQETGKYQIYTRLKDKAGNSSVYQLPYYYDIDPPVCSITVKDITGNAVTDLKNTVL